jgi:signal transduction histidine kinase
VPAEERERIFERFYETQDVTHHSSGDAEFGRSGLGIGLAITRGIVHAHGGSVRCEGRPAGGSRFVVELPLAHAQSIPGRGAGTAGSDASTIKEDLAA